MRGKRLAKERLRSGNAPIRSQHEVYAAPLLVHGSVQIVPLALDRDVRLVDAPGATDRAGKSIPALLKFRNTRSIPRNFVLRFIVTAALYSGSYNSFAR